ncbi:MAG: hypothetical protein Q7J98_05450 [Kiritimatiellia bacterium]|nr:hypothetical protein [Kiritimatiellia bacterium]
MKCMDKLIMVSIVCALTGVTTMKAQNKTFGDDLKFLAKNTDAIILSESAGQAKIAVSPKLQGRVLTSTAAGDKGLSFGWINRALISSGKIAQHINVYGGEDRFWLGPEGGQYSIFFKKDASFDLDHWFTPAAVDTEPFELIGKSNDRIRMKKDIRLENYSGSVFELRVDREVIVLESKDAVKLLNTQFAENVKLIAYQSNNRITNTGKTGWDKSTGMLSIWILGMFNPSPATTIVIPYQPGFEQELGPFVNDTYFGKVPADRLVIAKNVLFFKGDGQYRGKIGLSPKRAKSVLGSYDAANQVLTIVQYTKPKGVVDYVNSMWEIQKEPFRGDTINSYNDGPPKPGAKPLGPFYELETSSPAAALEPGRSMEHVHRTFHLQGDEKDLDPIVRAVLGVNIDEIKKAFN